MPEQQTSASPGNLTNQFNPVCMQVQQESTWVLPAATAISGAGAFGMSRSMATKRTIMDTPTASVVSDVPGKTVDHSKQVLNERTLYKMNAEKFRNLIQNDDGGEYIH